jgi:hypothetical protein
VDDGPPSDEVVTSVSIPSVTLVDSVPDGARVEAPVLRIDRDFVHVRLAGAERRFSRASGFEVRPGGGWSTWRLSGSDFRRVRVRRR